MELRERPTQFVAAGPIGQVLDQLDPSTERVYICGGSDGIAAARAWAAVLPFPWRSDPKRGHYLEGQFPIYRLVRGDGRRVEILRAAMWFGDAEPEACAAAWAELRSDVARRYTAGTLLSTPASTGRYLLTQTIPFERSWPTLDADTQQLIRSTSGQGRIEIFDRGPELPQLVEYDGRFMYAGLLWGLAGGVPVRDSVDEYAGQQRGRYRVTVTVPADWAHVGILATKNDRGGWSWPSSPREQFTTWADGAELGLAIEHGWRVRIHERMLWPAYTVKGPLDAWGDRMRKSYAQHRDASPLVARAVRAMALQTIGAFQGRAHRTTRIGTAEQVPADAANLRLEGDVMLWGEGTEQAWPEMAHPEWSAAIWARARVRLLDAPTGTKGRRAGALHVPASSVLAFRTDAVYLTADPGWPDDGAVGRLRRVYEQNGPLVAPTNQTQLLRMKGAH